MAQWLVVGLGNPGPSYASNRHNIGAMVVAQWARGRSLTWKARRFHRADTTQTRLGCEQIVLGMPRTYMNLSGIAVRNLVGDCKIHPDHLIVIHDELDLELGQIRTKFGGGDNGHNGLKSIRANLGGGDYYRIRIGVGRPPPWIDVTDWVLTNFAASDKQLLAETIARAGEVVESLVGKGLDATQTKYNS